MPVARVEDLSRHALCARSRTRFSGETTQSSPARERWSVGATLLGRGGSVDLEPANRIDPVRPSGRRTFLCKSYPTLRQARPRAGPEAAMRVRKISAQCVLQFTPSLAAGCVLHRPVSRVIHCSELSNVRQPHGSLISVRDFLKSGFLPPRGKVRGSESCSRKGHSGAGRAARKSDSPRD